MARIAAIVATIYLSVIFSRFRNCWSAAREVTQVNAVVDKWQSGATFDVHLVVTILLLIFVYVIGSHFRPFLKGYKKAA